MQILCWLSVGLMVFHYIGYPMLIGLLARLKTVRPLPDQEDLPAVTMLISVYNEEKVIRARLENCLKLDYPRDKLRILMMSDGSTDNTHGIVNEYAEHGIELRVVHGRVGKTGALNE